MIKEISLDHDRTLARPEELPLITKDGGSLKQRRAMDGCDDVE